jgi:hypothetical protein
MLYRKNSETNSFYFSLFLVLLPVVLVIGNFVVITVVTVGSTTMPKKATYGRPSWNRFARRLGPSCRPT